MGCCAGHGLGLFQEDVCSLNAAGTGGVADEPNRLMLHRDAKLLSPKGCRERVAVFLAAELTARNPFLELKTADESQLKVAGDWTSWAVHLARR